MASTPRVIQIQGENVSYTAKGAYIRQSLVALGLADGGLRTADALIAAAEPVKGDVIVLADAYRLNEKPALVGALRESHVLAAPSVLRAAEAAHAASIGVTVLLPASQQAGFENDIAQGTVLPVDRIPAIPLADALARLERDEAGLAAVAAMRRIVNDHDRHSFIYPPGHFSAESGGGQEKLTDRDIADLLKLIEFESAFGVLVICGGRVDRDVVDRLRDRFATYGTVVILSQNDQVADLPSAYTKIVRDAGRLPRQVLIDALARTTMEVVVASAGLSGADGPTSITSEKMIGIPRREQQAAEYYNTYGAKNLIALGKPWSLPPAAAAAGPAPDLATVLRGWAAAKNLLPHVPLAPAAMPGDRLSNKGPR